jgi:glycosyltransferase involved in cell wall biosynthesis
VKKRPLLVRLSERTVLKTTSAVIAVSEEVAAVLRGRGYDGPIHIIPLSVDLSQFRPRPKDSSLSQTLQLRTPVVGYFGRLVSEKGIHQLLQAFSSIRRETGAALLIVGDGPLAALCRGIEGARVVAGVAHLDIPRYLSLCDVLIVPSITTSRWKEQFGRVIIEALACGIAVVGSDSGAIPKLLRDTGGGVVVPEGNPAALATAVLVLLADSSLRVKLARSAQTSIGRYSTRRVASDFDAVFQGLVHLGRTPQTESIKAG